MQPARARLNAGPGAPRPVPGRAPDPPQQPPRFGTGQEAPSSGRLDQRTSQARCREARPEAGGSDREPAGRSDAAPCHVSPRRRPATASSAKARRVMSVLVQGTSLVTAERFWLTSAPVGAGAYPADRTETPDQPAEKWCGADHGHDVRRAGTGAALRRHAAMPVCPSSTRVPACRLRLLRGHPVRHAPGLE